MDKVLFHQNKILSLDQEKKIFSSLTAPIAQALSKSKYLE